MIERNGPDCKYVEIIIIIIIKFPLTQIEVIIKK
jgi:hypothetical protein